MGLSCRSGLGGLGVLLVVAGLVLAGLPAQATVHEVTDNCPPGWTGIAGEGSGGNRACVYVEVDTPNWSQLFDLVPPETGYEECPAGFSGTITHVDDMTMGLCYRVVYEVPSEPWLFVGVDASACEIPDREGEDPVIFVADGAVGFCVVPILEPGDQIPSIAFSTEPCERPEATDPELRVMGGGLQACADVSLYGLGNPQIEIVVGVFDEARETVPGYVPTP